MSLDWFREHVLPQIKVARVGRVVLVPPSQVEAWVAERMSQEEWASNG